MQLSVVSATEIAAVAVGLEGVVIEALPEKFVIVELMVVLVVVWNNCQACK